MRGRVAAIPILLLLSLPTYPQCNLSPVYSGQFRSSVLDIAVDDNDLWAATGYGVSLYNRSVDPPRLTASIAVPGTTRVVRVVNGTVYAGSGSSIAFIRKAGSALQIFKTIDAGGTVNDLLITPLAIFAATSAGLFQIDLLDFHKTTLTTSNANVTSLALQNQTLFATDGDSSVERFSISGIVQGISPFTGVPSSQLVRINNGRVYVSDRLQSTAIFTDSGTKLATVDTAFTGMAPLTGDVVFIGTNDPRVHAVDFTTPGTPIEVFEQSVPPAGGTINRISTLQRAGNRLYAAAGDLGLLTFDISNVAAPFAVHSYTDVSSTSVAALGGSMFVSRSAGAIYEYRISSTGTLTEARHWDTRVHVLRDSTSSGLLLSTTGNSAIVWSVASSSPIAVATIDFGGPAEAAALIGNIVYVLRNKALYRADISAATPTATQVALNGMKPSWLARAGTALALAEEISDETVARTSIRLLIDTTLTDPSIVDGVPPAGIAANGSVVAIFTYLGLTLIDFTSSPATQTLIPNSTSATALPQQLAFNGSSLLELTDTSLLVWNTAARTLTNRFTIPAPPVAVHGGTDAQLPIASIATTEGVASVLINSNAVAPSLYPSASGNSYYKKVAVGGKRMLLFDGRAADVYDITSTPRWIGGIRTGGLLDVAASESALYTLSSGGLVTAYSPAGVPLTQTTISEGTDSAPLAITTVAGVPWVSISKGCLTTGCAKKTFVLDPKTLTVTSTMAGGVTDATTSGTTAYALVDMPGEVRVIDVSNPALPNILRTRAVEGNRTPTAIAFSGSTVYVLGDQLYSYASESLAGSGQAVPFQNDPTATLRVAGSCGVMSGRTFGPLLYALPAFTAQTAPAVPAPATSVATQNGTVFIVTDSSLEIWSASALPAPARRRVTR